MTSITAFPRCCSPWDDPAPIARVSIFGRGAIAMSDEERASDEHFREIAEKIRQLARQTPIAEAQVELFDLADQLERMAEIARQKRGRRP